MIGDRQIEAEQMQERADQSFGLPKGQMEDDAQRQGHLDRHSRIPRLAARRGARRCLPRRNGIVAEPDGQTTTLAKARLIG